MDRYTFEISPDHLEYEFYSQGPKGQIKKLVRFQPFETYDEQLVNLAFGDWNENTQSIDDAIVSNNDDADKVLATVAIIVLDYTTHFPDVVIYASGSTPSRTRKYQMGINQRYNEIMVLFEIYGITKDDEIQLFIRSVNYAAFLVRRRAA